MSGTSVRRGDIVRLELQPDRAVDRVTLPVSALAVLALIETPATATTRASAWTPLVAWTGTSLFGLPQDGLAVTPVGHVRLLDAWTVSMQDRNGEWKFTIPGLLTLDRPRRLRVGFLTWAYEVGPLAGQAADWETVLFLSEL